MRTTVDIPKEIYQKAKIMAVREGITMKELFLRALSNELSDQSLQTDEKPWKRLAGKGSAAYLDPGTSGFDDYVGPNLLEHMMIQDPGPEASSSKYKVSSEKVATSDKTSSK
jgi:hypothetical protein